MRFRYAFVFAVWGFACGGSLPTQPAGVPSALVPPSSNFQMPMVTPPLTWDLEANGVPRFITHQYIDLPSIARISRFRSAEGHDYSDNVERCRSMKHYFVPRFTALDASKISVYSPVTGDVFRLRPEWAGVQIEIRSKEFPAFRPVLFHVNATIPLSEGTKRP